MLAIVLERWSRRFAGDDTMRRSVGMQCDQVGQKIVRRLGQTPVSPRAGATAADVSRKRAGRDRSRRGDRRFIALLAVSTSCPSAVTAIVCSKWAASDPSAVTTVHSSGITRVSWPPSITIGSTATTSPGFISGPRPGAPKFWMNGSSCIARPIPCPPYSRTSVNPAPSATCWIAAPMSESRPPGRITAIAASSASSVTRTELLRLGRRRLVPDDHRHGRVALEPFPDRAAVERQHISGLQGPRA